MAAAASAAPLGTSIAGATATFLDFTSAAGATSRSHTDGSEGGDASNAFGATNRTLLLEGDVSEPTQQQPVDLMEIVERMEALQFAQRSPQQPSPELDRLIAQTFNMRPEWRQRIAVLTKSPWLRKKILAYLPAGGRGCGSAMLGSTHPWRQDKLPDEFSDHSWPKVQLNHKGDFHLPGGSSRHHRLLRAPVDKVRHDPLVSHSQDYSFSKGRRFPGCHDNGELNKAAMQKRGTPGPGAYFKSVPRGTAFSADNGETVVFGANHIFPWKSALGHNINPIDADHTTLTSQPKWSFPKSRRSASETISGHGQQDGGPIKTDLGCISPGPVYEHHSTFRANTGRALSLKPRRSRSTPAIAKVRCKPEAMPPEDPPREEIPAVASVPEVTFVKQRHKGGVHGI